MFAFSCKLGSYLMVQAKLWAMYHGLKLIKERGIHDLVQVESNSALVVQIANSDCACDHQGERYP